MPSTVPPDAANLRLATRDCLTPATLTHARVATVPPVGAELHGLLCSRVPANRPYREQSVGSEGKVMPEHLPEVAAGGDSQSVLRR
jgi:hypothetical protein